VDNQGTKKAAAVFASAFAASFAESLSQAAGSSFQLRVLESPDLATRQGQPVHFRLTAEGGLRGQCFVELYRPQVATLAAKIQGVPVEEFSGEQADALEPAISAAMAGTAEALSAEYGGVTFKVERVEDLAFGGMFVVPLAASAEEYPEIAVLLYFDGQLLNALAPASAKTDAAAAGSISVDATNLKLVLDVELNMSLRFGQRQLPLRDVLELASGSVIELDRQVDDPVELLLDGKVIARGEAVIVDGNYGLRVTEVPQPIASQLGY
jgi:flagellar motor switch protein FliN/FliY